MSALSELPHSLKRIYRLGVAQVAVGVVGLYFAGVTAAITYSRDSPAPTAYIKSAVWPVDSSTDPKSVIKLRNNGGGSFDIISMKILSKNQKIESFAELFKRYQGDNFSLSSESEPFIKSGHVGRNIAGLSSFVIATIRPSKTDEKGREWEKEFRKFIAANDVEIEIEYTSLALPLLKRTVLFTEKKRLKL